METCSCCRRAFWASRARACKAQRWPWLYILGAAFEFYPAWTTPPCTLGRLRPTAFWKIPNIGHSPNRNLLVSEVALKWCEARFRQKPAKLKCNAADTTMTSKPRLHLIDMLLQESKKATYGRKIGIGRMKILPFVFRPCTSSYQPSNLLNIVRWQFLRSQDSGWSRCATRCAEQII